MFWPENPVSDPTHPVVGAAGSSFMNLCSGLPFLPRTDQRSGTVEEEGRDADQMVINASVASNNQLLSAGPSGSPRPGPGGSARGQAWERVCTTEPGDKDTGL